MVYYHEKDFAIIVVLLLITNKYYNHDFTVVAQKLLQKFSPFLVTVAGEIIQFVPRQRFLIAIVNNEKVSDKVLIMFLNAAV